jgi:hypothetical protein
MSSQLESRLACRGGDEEAWRPESHIDLPHQNRGAVLGTSRLMQLLRIQIDPFHIEKYFRHLIIQNSGTGILLQRFLNRVQLRHPYV